MTYALVFPGQGSQSVGMLSALAEQSSVVTDTFAEASEALGYDLWSLVQSGPEAELNQTQVTQPAMLTAGLAVYRVMQAQTSLRPAMMAGHSLGEYTAMVASGAMRLADGVSLVALRGRLMQSAVPEGQGAMAAVLGLSDEQVMDVCVQASGVVEAVNFNAPGQVVVAGHKSAVEQALPAFEQAGAKRVVMLPVSVPSHCSLMASIEAEFASALDQVVMTSPQVPVVHNATVESYESVEKIKHALVSQLSQPVYWSQTIEYFKAQGVDSLYELGPGKVLAGLNRRIDRKMGMQAVYDSATLSQSIRTLKDASCN